MRTRTVSPTVGTDQRNNLAIRLHNLAVARIT
jgi:hypothetical protein